MLPLRRLAHPDQPWLHLVGLLHSLGKLLAHADWGAEPQWAVCGESYPLGVRFHPAILHSQFFSANPDRRRRAYSTPTGVYAPGCGLNQVRAVRCACCVLCALRVLGCPGAGHAGAPLCACACVRVGVGVCVLMCVCVCVCVDWNG